MGQCIFYSNDFLHMPTLASATADNELYSYQDTNVLVKQKTTVDDIDVEQGVAQISVLDTDNDEGGLQFNLINRFAIDNSAGNNGAFAYEIRLKVNELSANDVGIMCGLVEGPVATGHSVDDTGEIKTGLSFLGFRGLATDPQNLDFGYQDTGGSALVVAQANAAALVEDTYTNIGFRYDPNGRDSAKIRAYQDGTLVASVTLTQIDTSTFPEAEAMVPFVIGKCFGSATSGTVSIDRVTFAQYTSV
jgi:hypothetical protein